MSKIFIERQTLKDIADAIRDRNFSEDAMTPAKMAEEIYNLPEAGSFSPMELGSIDITENGEYHAVDYEDIVGFASVNVNVPTGGGDLPEEALNLTGSCKNKFYYDSWDWFIEHYGSQITTNEITDCSYMFLQSKIKEIPFDINVADNSKCDSIITSCHQLRKAPYIKGKPKTLDKLFSNCSRLTEIPEDLFDYLDLSTVQTSTASFTSILEKCYSLRKVPQGFIDNVYNVATSYFNYIYYNGYNGLYVVDELKNMLIPTHTAFTGSIFYNTFYNCQRLKSLTFKMNDDGTPIVARLKNQNLTLTASVGCVQSWSLKDITDYTDAHGIDESTMVNSDATYQALKDHPDYWASMPEYSRYNHDSAVETINSLPDTSAYLAEVGGTNTIKFLGASGSKTDGGAINTLTEEEIAVAASRGWTVTLA